MASLDSVRGAAATDPRDRGAPRRRSSTTPARSMPRGARRPDGIEATLALMVVGPFVLEAGLLPLLEATPGSRVIAVTSGGMYTQRLPLDDLGYRSVPYAGPAGVRPRQAGPGRPRCASGRAGPRRGVRSPPCTRAGPTRRASRSRCPGSTGSCDRCCARPSRGSTRSSGSRRTPSREPSTGACSSTAGPAVRPRAVDAAHGGRPTAALGPRRRAWPAGRGSDVPAR